MIILTGGAGFIGSCFLWKLNEKGINDIIIVDDLDKPGKCQNLEGKSYSDYIQKDDFLAMVKEDKAPVPEFVVHMGACSSTILTDTEYYIKNNYEYSKILAKWALSKKANFMYASSAATYGDGSEGYSDDTESTYNLKPLNMYGFSKHLFDLWVIKNDLIDKVTGIKFFNVFGPNEYHKEEMRSVVCKAFKQVRDEGKMRLFRSYNKDYDDGEQKRDFIYIKDAVEIMYYLFKNPQITGIYNLGTGKARSWNDLAKAMFKTFKKKPVIEYIDMPENLREKYQYFTQADMSKLQSKIKGGYEFQELEKSIADYMKYLDDGKNL